MLVGVFVIYGLYPCFKHAFSNPCQKLSPWQTNPETWAPGLTVPFLQAICHVSASMQNELHLVLPQPSKTKVFLGVGAPSISFYCEPSGTCICDGKSGKQRWTSRGLYTVPRASPGFLLNDSMRRKLTTKRWSCASGNWEFFEDMRRVIKRSRNSNGISCFKVRDPFDPLMVSHTSRTNRKATLVLEARNSCFFMPRCSESFPSIGTCSARST